MTPSKYDREYKSRHDQEQTTFDAQSPSFLKVKLEQKAEMVSLHTGTYCCPFCLHSDKIGAYLISTKHGYHRGLGKCPECGNQMQLKSLTSDWSPEQYADFMFEYARQGGWQKVPFKKWLSRLKAYGWSLRFWSRYHQLKGDKDETSYEDYIDRKQKDDEEEYYRKQAEEHEM